MLGDDRVFDPIKTSGYENYLYNAISLALTGKDSIYIFCKTRFVQLVWITAHLNLNDSTSKLHQKFGFFFKFLMKKNLTN